MPGYGLAVPGPGTLHIDQDSRPAAVSHQQPTSPLLVKTSPVTALCPAMYIACPINGSTSVAEPPPAACSPLQVFLRERLNGYYGVSNFVVANTLASAPFIMGISLISSIVVYWLAGLNDKGERGHGFVPCTAVQRPGLCGLPLEGAGSFCIIRCAC